MPDSVTMNVREAETQLAKYREEFQKLRQEFLDDGEIDREEEQILKDIESIIARVEAQIAEKKTGSDDSETAETEDGDAGREAWEARTSDYRKLIVSADTLQNEGNPNAPTLTKFLNRIDDAVAEDRWGEAVELLDLAQMTVQSATGGTEGEDADPGAAKWAELAGDYDGVVNEINELRSDEHPDIERFEDFVTQMDRAVREERWNDAISTLDLAQSALGAAGFKPEGAGEGPEASDALAELAEGEAEPSRDGAEAAPSPGTAGETGDESAGDSDTFWADEFNRRYFEAQTLTEASERFTELGYDEADEMSTTVDQLIKASEEERYFDFIELLDAGLVLMRAINRRHGETPSEDQGGESDWSDRIEDHERLQHQIARLENSEDSDDSEILDEIYTFNRLIGKAVADGNYADAIRYLDSALMIIPTSKPSDTPSSDDPAEPTEPGGGGDDSEDEWLQMADQLSELQRLMQQLIGAGGNVATGIVAAFTDILKASAERRWEDAVSLLTTALASARQLVEDIGGGDTPAPNTTDPIVPGVTPDGPGGTEPGQINPASASISGSVGKGGKNVAADVQTVQQLLNQNGASPALEVDGMVGPKTNGAISKFQQEALGFQDGRVDPGGQTWGALTSGGGAVPAEQPEAGGGGAGGGSGSGETPTGGERGAQPNGGNGNGNSQSAELWQRYDDSAARLNRTIEEFSSVRALADRRLEEDADRANQFYGEAFVIANEAQALVDGFSHPDQDADQNALNETLNLLAAIEHKYNSATSLFRAGDAQWDHSEVEDGGEEGGDAGKAASEIARAKEKLNVAETQMRTKQALLIAATVNYLALLAVDPDRANLLYAAANSLKTAADAAVSVYKTPGPDADIAELRSKRKQANGTRIQCDIAVPMFRDADNTWDISEYQDEAVEEDIGGIADVEGNSRGIPSDTDLPDEDQDSGGSVPRQQGDSSAEGGGGSYQDDEPSQDAKEDGSAAADLMGGKIIDEEEDDDSIIDDIVDFFSDDDDEE